MIAVSPSSTEAGQRTQAGRFAGQKKKCKEFVPTVVAYFQMKRKVHKERKHKLFALVTFVGQGEVSTLFVFL